MSNRKTRTSSSRLRRHSWQLSRLEDRVTPVTQLLPDLHVLAANLSGSFIGTDSSLPGRNLLKFNTAMANGGVGAFELQKTSTIITDPDGTQHIQVNQRIFNDDATFIDRIAGYFTYHPSHGHTHFDDFAVANLRLRPLDNSVGDIIVSGPKTSFCLQDTAHYAPGLPGSPSSAGYPGCGDQRQGISVGWNDVYGSYLPDQWIDVTGIPNGNYWLEVVADPSDHILELDETNNVTRVAITISALPSTGFHVQFATPAGATEAPVSYVDYRFNQAIDPSTFTIADVISFNGPNGNIPVTGVKTIDAVTMRLEFAPQSQQGTYTLTTGNDIKSASGSLIDQNNNGITGELADQNINIFALTSPRVNSVLPTGPATPPISKVTVNYNRAMDSSTFDLSDIASFTGPGGVDLLPAITSIVPITPGGQSASFAINFAAQTTDGLYSIVIEPSVQDLAGQSVDMNGDGKSDTADRFTSSFTISPAGTYGPDGFGYTARQSNLLDLSALSGWTTIINSADDSNAKFNIGTNQFNFYGTNYTGTQIYVNTNGLITFGAGTSSYENNDLSSMTYNSTTVYIPAIAVLWDDWLNGGVTPQVRGLMRDTNSDGSMDELIIQWNKTQHYQGSTNDSATFEAVLQLNTGNTPGKVILNYTDLVTGDAFANGASATVGLRSNGQTSYFKLPVSQDGNSSLVGSGKAITVSVPSVASITRLGDNPNSVGEVEYQVTFSEGVTGVDPTDFKITMINGGTGNLKGAVVKHIHTSIDPSIYEIHIQSYTGSGDLRLDVVDDGSIMSTLGAPLGGLGIVNGDFTGETYNIVQPAPTVDGINIGDGTGQRSMVELVQVFFDWHVEFAGGDANAAAAFQLMGPNGIVPVNVDLSMSDPDQTWAKLSFSPGAGVELNGSLKDGSYTLTILSSNISTGGVAFDGDNNGTPGGNFVTQFHRLFGDGNGDGQVSAVDFNLFRTFYGTSNGLTMFDIDGDNLITAADFNAFRGNYGIVLIP